MLVKLISHKSVQRRVLITTLPWILNVVVRIVKVRNAPMNTLHFISNNGFFLFLILWKRSNNYKTDMERKNYLCRFFLNLTLADYNNLWQGLVNKTKYKMDKNIYEKKKLYSFTYPRSAQCINICRAKYR